MIRGPFQFSALFLVLLATTAVGCSRNVSLLDARHRWNVPPDIHESEIALAEKLYFTMIQSQEVSDSLDAVRHLLQGEPDSAAVIVETAYSTGFKRASNRTASMMSGEITAAKYSRITEVILGTRVCILAARNGRMVFVTNIRNDESLTENVKWTFAGPVIAVNIWNADTTHDRIADLFAITSTSPGLFVAGSADGASAMSIQVLHNGKMNSHFCINGVSTEGSSPRVLPDLRRFVADIQSIQHEIFSFLGKDGRAVP